MPKSNKKERTRYWQERLDIIVAKEEAIEAEYKSIKIDISVRKDQYKKAIKEIKEEKETNDGNN